MFYENVFQSTKINEKIFENLFNIWLNRRHLEAHIYFFNLLCVVQYMKNNPVPCRYVVGKGKHILIVFSDNCEYSPLILYQNSTSGIFLTFKRIVISETVLKNFLYSVILNLLAYLALWPMHFFFFYPSMIFYHVIVIWKISVHWVMKIVFQMLTHFIIQYRENHIPYYQHQLHQKSLLSISLLPSSQWKI